MENEFHVEQRPDNTAVEENGGFTFVAWGIHVAAKTLAEAKEHTKEFHGKDVDNDIPPPIRIEE